MIIFSSFGGRKFDDSPYALYQTISKDPYFNDYKLIWCFVSPNEFDIPRGEKVKIDTFSFFKVLVKAKITISNTNIDRGIRYTRKGAIRIETWHGTPLKKIESDENGKIGKIFPPKKIDKSTIRCCQSNYDKEIFKRIFNASEECFIHCDLPRNDRLSKYNQDELIMIKQKMNLNPNKKIILYAPTYREYLINENNQTYIAPPINIDKWRSLLSSDYILLVRAHYAVTSSMQIKDDDFIKDVSDYPNLNDLYLISDLLISDYSSVFFDYSILERPMYCFAYDYDEYLLKRGLYLDLKDVFPGNINYNEDDLLNEILTSSNKEKLNSVKDFKNKYIVSTGHANDTLVNIIKKYLKNR